MDELPDELEGGFNEADPASNPEVVDVPLDEFTDLSQPEPEISEQSEMDILRKVMTKGSVMFSDGRMLTKCPSYSDPAICGMYPMPHPQTGDTMMVCTGPTIAEKTIIRLFSANEVEYTTKKCHRDCPYKPDRLNEEPEYHENSDNKDSEGWL